jgi:hypothetical protein
LPMIVGIASWTHTIKDLRDLGIPTILGALLGAGIGAWAQAKGRNIEHDRALDLLVLQDERESADQIDRALRDLEVRIAQGGTDFGSMHNDWQDNALDPTSRLREGEIRRRVSLVGFMLFYSMHGSSGLWSYPTQGAIEDARAALRAFLRREPIPPPQFPDYDTLKGLVTRGGRIDPDPLNAWFAKQAGFTDED